MPRAPRVFVDGGIYHVYNRVTRGERVFDQDEEALELVRILREVRDRDRLVVLAWCVMSNHYHLAVCCTAAPLSRSMASIQSRVSKSFNRRHRQLGPFWQGRYKAKLVEDSAYLQQLVLYIHLNPVSAGVVERPEQYPWSGHREVVRSTRAPLVQTDQLLLTFGERRRAARKLYLAAIRAAKEEPWTEASPGALPWWRFGRPVNEEADGELGLDPSTPFIDELGRSTGVELPQLSAGELVDRALNELEIDRSEIAGRTKRRDVVRAREMLMTIGVERFRLRVKDLAEELDVNYDTASLWGRRGAKRRTEDRDFAHGVEALVAAVVSSGPAATERECSDI